MLDGPFDAKDGLLVQESWKRRRTIIEATKQVPAASLAQIARRPKMDIEEVMEMFVKASELFDPVRLPRQRIHWLENLVRLHGTQNRAEGAEVRWRIVNICSLASSTFSLQWAPRSPLEWSKGTPVGGPAGNRSFDNLLATTLSRPINTPWNSAQQLSLHMETSLSLSIDRFSAVGLLYLVERSASRLMDMYRITSRIDKMAIEFGKLSTVFKTIAESGSVEFALGTFYWVQYVGKGKFGVHF